MNKKLSILLMSVSMVLLGCSENKTINSASLQHQSIEVADAQPSLLVQQDLDNIANTLQVDYRLITNVPSGQCDKKIADGQCFTVGLTFTAPQAFNKKGWEIYFSHISPIQSSQSDSFVIEHINGDLHKLSLKDNFTGFTAGESKTVIFRAMFWSLSEYDALPNYIVSADHLTAKVIKSTQVAFDPKSGLEYLPFVESYTDKNKQFKRTASDKTQWLNPQVLFERNKAVAVSKKEVTTAIIPTPKQIVINKSGATTDLSQGLNFSFKGVDQKQVAVAIARLAQLGFAQNPNGLTVNLRVDSNTDKVIGSYQLAISDNAIDIVGVDGSGVFNGLQSLASLITVGVNTVPQLTIDDEPHYAFRGMLVDVARNFHSKEFILKLLDQMAAYKLNKLHLHLGDDEGWRLEIPSLPELTEVGSKRCFDSQEQSCLISQLGAGVDTNSPVNGFYSVADYSEILTAATARHIQVIPSLDMPGHSRAAIKAMTVRYNKYMALENEEKANQFRLHDFDDKTVYSSVQFYNDNTINACLESSYAFVNEVMQQVKQIHADAGQPLTRYHIGADETAGAWVESPVCKDFVANNSYGVTDVKQIGRYFIERVAKILTDLDIETAGWSDGLEHTKKETMPAIVQANAWDVLAWDGHKKVHQLANRDWQIVISTPDVLYFDFPYEADPKEFGYYWASRHTNTEKVFQFMPGNLPIHAEFWLDREDKNYSADDREKPMKVGNKFLGIQGQLWSENTRTDETAEHKIFPRLLALAERAWYLPNWAVPYNYQGALYNSTSHVFTEQQKTARNQQWQTFAHTLGKKEFAKLALGDIEFRLPTVGAVVKDGLLYANIAFPGLTIEYQVNDGPWLTYKLPVKIEDVEGSHIQLRSRNGKDKRSSRVTQL